MRAALDDACAGAGFVPRVVFEASALSMVVHLARLGLGAGIVPATVAPFVSPGALVLPIAHGEVRSRLELAWPVEGPQSPAGRALVEHARRCVVELVGAATSDRGNGAHAAPA